MIFNVTFTSFFKHPQTGDSLGNSFLSIEAESKAEVERYLRQTFSFGWVEIFPNDQFNESFFPGGQYGETIII